MHLRLRGGALFRGVWGNIGGTSEQLILLALVQVFNFTPYSKGTIACSIYQYYTRRLHPYFKQSGMAGMSSQIETNTDV